MSNSDTESTFYCSQQPSAAARERIHISNEKSNVSPDRTGYAHNLGRQALPRPATDGWLWRQRRRFTNILVLLCHEIEETDS